MQGATGWTVEEIRDRTGQVVLVTGANSGIGWWTAKAYVDAGAHVVLACRDVRKAQAAADKMSVGVEDPSIEVLELDLAKQASVHRAVERFMTRHERLDLLVNNAGVMAAPKRVTDDGFESQFATNHFGHFTLSALLAAMLYRTSNSTVVTVSSLMHRNGRLDLSSPTRLQHLNGRYAKWRTYADTKLANLYFAFELDRRLRRAGVSTRSLAAHPGYSHTELVSNGPARGGGSLRATCYRIGGQFGQSAKAGALPTLLASSGDLPGGTFTGPLGLGGMAGAPGVVRAAAKAYDEEVAEAFFDLSEELTGVEFAFPATL